MVEHQSGVEQSAEFDPVGGHLIDDRLMDGREDVLGLADEAWRSVDAHAAGVGPLVVVHDSLVVAAQRQRQDVGAGDDRHRGGLHAGETVFDHDAIAGRAEGAGKHLIDGRVGVVDVVGDDHALAGGEAVGLEHG